MSLATGTCSRCEGVLDGAHHSYCKACTAAYQREWRAQDPEGHRAYQRQWHRANPDKTRQYKQKFRLKSEFGISVQEYTAMLTSQDYLCAICGEPFPNQKATHVDHDHASGRVRGILCQNCNLMLGMAKDNPGTLDRAIRYLKGSE